MGKRQLSEEQKRKMQEGRQRALANGGGGGKRASFDEQIAAAQAAADAGDSFAANIVDLVRDFQAQLAEAEKLPKVLKKKMRKLLATLKDN